MMQHECTDRACVAPELKVCGDRARGWDNGGLAALLAALILCGVATPLCAESLARAWETAIAYDHGLKSVQRRSEAAAQHLAAARAVRIPSLDLRTGYTALDNTPTEKALFGGQVVEFPISEQNSVSASAMTVLPIYTSGRIRSGIDAADALLHASRGDEQTAIEDLHSRILLQVRQAWLNLNETRQRVAVTRSALRAASENLRVMRARYHEGLATNTEVLDAESLDTRSESNHADARYDFILAGLRLRRAVGQL